MMKIVKSLFTSKKDAAGNKVDRVITMLAAQANNSAFAWSYIEEEAYYENTTNGRRVYSYEVSRKAA